MVNTGNLHLLTWTVLQSALNFLQEVNCAVFVDLREFAKQQGRISDSYNAEEAMKWIAEERLRDKKTYDDFVRWIEDYEEGGVYDAWSNGKINEILRDQPDVTLDDKKERLKGLIGTMESMEVEEMQKYDERLAYIKQSMEVDQDRYADDQKEPQMTKQYEEWLQRVRSYKMKTKNRYQALILWLKSFWIEFVKPESEEEPEDEPEEEPVEPEKPTDCKPPETIPVPPEPEPVPPEPEPEVPPEKPPCNIPKPEPEVPPQKPPVQIPQPPCPPKEPPKECSEQAQCDVLDPAFDD